MMAHTPSTLFLVQVRGYRANSDEREGRFSSASVFWLGGNVLHKGSFFVENRAFALIASGLIAFAALLASWSPLHAQDAGPDQYRLAPADQIAVSLPLNPEVNATGTIGPDGRFSIPLVGRLPLGGHTVDEAERLIADAFRSEHIVADARPNIAVTTYNAAIYVAGEVRTPGAIALNRPLNAYQAVVLAGGLLDTARSGKVAVISRTATGAASVRLVNLHDYPRNDAASPLLLAPGDVLFIPKSRIAEINQWIEQHINKVVPNSLKFNVNIGDTSTATSAIVTP
jgi:protein involved in polysaccharide export with SLBB domain